MRTIATKVDNSLHEKVLSRCNSLDCNPSEYLRNLIRKDLDNSDKNNGNNELIIATRATNTKDESISDSKSSSVFHLPEHHTNNNNYSSIYATKLKLVKLVMMPIDKYHVDTDGKRYLIKPEGRLLPISKVKNLRIVYV